MVFYPVRTAFKKPSLSNRTLLVLSGLIGVVGLSLCLSVATASPKRQWQDLQRLLLPKALSGQPEVLGASTGGALPQKVRLPILMYHHVGIAPAGSDQLRRDLTVSPDDFELQVSWLKGQGFNSVSLAQVLAYFERGTPLPENPVVLTFDDGYEDAFSNAVPILKRHGFSGSFAVITQFAGLESGTNRYASWDQIRSARRAGMEIISHTQDHFDGTDPKYTDRFIKTNLAESQNDIRANLKADPLPIIVYPYGHFDGRYIKLAKEAGFQFALTTEAGASVRSDELMEVPRIRVHGRQSLETFKQRILN